MKDLNTFRYCIAIKKVERLLMWLWDGSCLL